MADDLNGIIRNTIRLVKEALREGLRKLLFLSYHWYIVQNKSPFLFLFWLMP